ncbi:BON domain-containing protein [Bordetella sp. H567]|uniref:BON domain-containing protein n=1 Tax=Bordetella sp. H567 TaxID=1697043 RepID=UPI00082B1608|nr:BON domain-containing protein [Bordetella sp. H567]
MKNHLVDTLVAAALGAAAMYYFDPETGRRRRAVLRDQAAGRAREARQYVRRQARWTGDRLQGMAAQVRHAASAGVPASDRKVHERVRTAIGRAISTPGAIDVNVSAGNVLLTGHVLAADREKLVQAVSSVDGVERVSDQLAEYGAAGNVPELQGAQDAGSKPASASKTMSQSAPEGLSEPMSDTGAEPAPTPTTGS